MRRSYTLVASSSPVKKPKKAEEIMTDEVPAQLPRTSYCSPDITWNDEGDVCLTNAGMRAPTLPEGAFYRGC